MNPGEIIYQRRVRVLEHAQRTKNVAATCRIFGISRTRYYEWKKRADRYGLEALMPKERRAPQMPDTTPTHVIEALLTLAVQQPTLGCRRYADLLADQGFSVAKSTVQKHLVAHGLGRRSQRLARAAAIAALTTGLVTQAARDDEPFGFCLATGGPGELVCLDSFYIGKLKGVGKVYQLTAIDVFTRWAFAMIVLGPVHAPQTMRFIERLLGHYRRHGINVRAVLTDGGPEYIASDFRAHLVAKGLRHERIPARSPNHHAVVERFQGTMLKECWRPAFHRRHFTSIRQLQAEADAWRPVTTAAGATTATTCAAAPLKRSSTPTSDARQHEDHQPPQRPSVTSTPGPEVLVRPYVAVSEVPARPHGSNNQCCARGALAWANRHAARSDGAWIDRP